MDDTYDYGGMKMVKVVYNDESDMMHLWDVTKNKKEGIVIENTLNRSIRINLYCLKAELIAMEAESVDYLRKYRKNVINKFECIITNIIRKMT